MVIGGGIIPEDDIPLLKEMGVAEVFTPGAPTTDDRRVGRGTTSPTTPRAQA